MTLAATLVGVTSNAHAVPPGALTVTAPTAGATVSGTIRLEARLDVWADDVAWLVDGHQIGDITSSPWSLSWNTSTVADGQHKITAVADVHGEKNAESQPATVTVDNDSAKPTPTPTASTPTSPTPTSSPSSSSPTPSPTSSGPTASAPCGRTASAPATYAHVVWIVFENHSYSEVIGSSAAPYLNHLADACGSASDMHAETHPSLPNYIAMTSGSTQGITDDNGPAAHPLGSASIFSVAGDWRSLEESMPAPCSATDSGRYAVKHNPAVYYTQLGATCPARDVPLQSTPDVSAAFTFITPDLCDDMHDCDVATGDRWLSGVLPAILASPEYAAGRTAIFVTWDEDDRSTDNHIATLVIAPSVHPGTTSATSFNHYSMLRTTEEMLGLSPLLGAAASATSMRSAFGI